MKTRRTDLSKKGSTTMKPLLPVVIVIISVSSPGAPQGQTGGRQDNRIVEGTAYTRPVATSKPVFLRDTIEVQLKTKETYWKSPNQNYYTSWIPRASFQVLYDGTTRLRYTAEWVNPDGSPWFTESLGYNHNGNDIAQIASEYSDELMNTKAAAAVGTFRLKITNGRTNEVAFQGKFKVQKMLAFPG